MTANQIALTKAREEERAHRASEALTQQSLAESQRHNLQTEYETNRANTLNYQAQIYHAEVSKYSAELNASASRYASDLNYAANMEKNRIQADTLNETKMQNVRDTAIRVEQQQIERDKLAIEQQKAGSSALSSIGAFVRGMSTLIPILVH